MNGRSSTVVRASVVAILRRLFRHIKQSKEYLTHTPAIRGNFCLPSESHLR